MKTNALVVSEEEQLVFDDWAADAAPEFIVSKRVLPLGRIFEEIPGIKLLIAVVFVRRSVKGVRAALADGDQDGAAGFAIFRRHSVLLDAKLLN